MKKILLISLLAFSGLVFAEASVDVEKRALGAGKPAAFLTLGSDRAVYIDDGYYFAPQYMPMYPTAGVIWPRIVAVDCDVVGNGLACDGYEWLPKLGRGEYLFVIPQLRKAPPVSTITQSTTVPIIVYKEVAPKGLDE